LGGLVLPGHSHCQTRSVKIVLHAAREAGHGGGSHKGEQAEDDAVLGQDGPGVRRREHSDRFGSGAQVAHADERQMRPPFLQGGLTLWRGDAFG
jgi:hypothetical protein